MAWMHRAALSQRSSWIGKKSLYLANFLVSVGALFQSHAGAILHSTNAVHIAYKVFVMVLLTLGDEVFLVVPLRRRKCVAYDGDDAIVLSLYDWMIGMPKKELGIQLPGKIKP